MTDTKGTIEFLKQQEGELLIAKNEANPVYGVSGIQVALEEKPAIFFEKIKGYPGLRSTYNTFSGRDRISELFSIDDWRQLKWKCLKLFF